MSETRSGGGRRKKAEEPAGQAPAGQELQAGSGEGEALPPAQEEGAQEERDAGLPPEEDGEELSRVVERFGEQLQELAWDDHGIDVRFIGAELRDRCLEMARHRPAWDSMSAAEQRDTSRLIA